MDPPKVALAGAGLFQKRATRLRELMVQVPPLDEFLEFMARVVQAQHQVLTEQEPGWKPAEGAFDEALKHGLPPLGFQSLLRDVNWQSDLSALLDSVEFHIGQRQRALLESLRNKTAEELDAIAVNVLEAGSGSHDDRPLMPLVAAALQVTWVRLAQALPRAPDKPGIQAEALCPTCGSPPVASVIHGEQYRSGVRYLHCSLCATEWHLERVKCSLCGEGGQLTYLGLDDENGKPFLPIQAEACDHCDHYLKVALRELHGRADPVADNLASLALDVMLAEEGKYSPSGYNPLLIIGD
ncbi:MULTISPECIES: formate dehydrogenase accessory protein FdhE [Pseudomonas]|uniref:formate dehydrogenase accessory protein FdhE n=1 Tax=Pseudomonas TaxID=286 RepID=UPI00123B1994|nr:MULTISPECIES: formate dehydrogenase accessory protein FdhE [Pseudomonas]QIB53275.1 formate dehydrogenase accessory protein FdhE [Pseudomonas sp. OIL-1]